MLAALELMIGLRYTTRANGSGQDGLPRSRVTGGHERQPSGDQSYTTIDQRTDAMVEFQKRWSEDLVDFLAHQSQYTNMPTDWLEAAADPRWEGLQDSYVSYMFEL